MSCDHSARVQAESFFCDVPFDPTAQLRQDAYVILFVLVGLRFQSFFMLTTYEKAVRIVQTGAFELRVGR